MDPSNLSPADGLEAVHQNGVSNDVDPSVAEITETAAPNGNVENFNQLDSAATDNLSVAVVREGSNDSRDGNNVNTSNVRDFFFFFS